MITDPTVFRVEKNRDFVLCIVALNPGDYASHSLSLTQT